MKDKFSEKQDDGTNLMDTKGVALKIERLLDELSTPTLGN